MRKFLLCAFSLLASFAQAEEITVSNETQLRALASSGKTYERDVIKLDADIALTSGYWTPIGTVSTPFKGTFNGQGHCISGISINHATGTNYAGLFGVIAAGGTVKNLKVEGATPIYSNGDETNTCYVGAIAAVNNGTISQCIGKALISGSHKNAWGGGIAGYNTGTIENSYVVADLFNIDDSSLRLAGIVGNNGGTVRNCWYKGQIYNISMTGRDYICNGTASTACFYYDVTDNFIPTADVTLADATSNTGTLDGKNGLTGQSVLLADDRTLFADGDWNTVCLPFDIPQGATGCSPIAGATVMTLTSSTYVDNILTLNFGSVTSMVAGKPYIVKWSDTAIEFLTNPVFLNVTVSNATNDATTDYVDFMGTFAPVSIPEEGDNTILYLGSENGLYYPNGTMTINCQRGYFKLKKGIHAPDIATSRMAFIDEQSGGEATGISTMQSNNERMINDNWLMLDGRRVANSQIKKGLYIRNGKKIFIK